MTTSFVGGLIVGGILGVAAVLIIKALKEKHGVRFPTARTVDVTVITESPGVDQQDVLLDAGSDAVPNGTIRWTMGPRVSTFHVDFRPGQSPFGGPNQEHFNPGNPHSHGVVVNPGHGKVKCYKYSVTVNDTQTFDPQVIIMGN